MSNKTELTLKQNIEDALYRFRGSIEASHIDNKILKLLTRIDNASESEKRDLQEKHATLIDQFVRMHEFDKHFLLAESLPTKFAAMSIRMTKDLIQEYSCTNNLEKSLVEIIVNAFCRSLHFSRLSTVALSSDSIPIDQNSINYYNFLSREIDKSNRQYLSALMTLQQIKSPAIKVNLKAETAILGQNQQFNSVNENSNEKNKTN